MTKRKQSLPEPLFMPRVNAPRFRIITARLSDGEMEALHNAARQCEQKTSDFVREALKRHTQWANDLHAAFKEGDE